MCKPVRVHGSSDYVLGTSDKFARKHSPCSFPVCTMQRLLEPSVSLCSNCTIPRLLTVSGLPALFALSGHRPWCAPSRGLALQQQLRHSQLLSLFSSKSALEEKWIVHVQARPKIAPCPLTPTKGPEMDPHQMGFIFTSVAGAWASG